MALALPEPPAFRVFPLHGIRDGACTCGDGTCKDVGKHPAVRWRTYDENTKGPQDACGVQTGHFNGIFVLDLDRKDDKDGVARLVELAAGRNIPDTLSVLTPSGGVHLYFRLPSDLYVPNSRSELAVGIDVRGQGGYVVAPGSPHRNGGVYQEVPGPLADAPAWLLELVVKAPESREPLETEHHTIDPTSPDGIRAIEWARKLSVEAEPAIQGQGGSDKLFALCCRLMYTALPLATLRQVVEEAYNPRCVPPWSVAEIDHKLTDADQRFDKPRGLPSENFFLDLASRTKNTEPKTPDPKHEYTFEIGMRSNEETQKASFGEVAGDLFDHKDWAGVWAYDSFRDRIVAVDPPMQLDAETTSGLSDNDVQLVRAWLEYHGKKLQTVDVCAAIEAVARRRKFNPVQDMLESLEWDGVPRLERVLPEYFKSPDRPYERAIGPRWFISLVARAMDPGCQSDCTLILEGDQGIGKTSSFRALMRDPTWHAESSCGVDSKDFYENLRGVWLMGFDELDSLTRGSLTKVKTELTKTRDRYRRSYGRNSTDFPRCCGFCGSTNASQYLNDPTGARRFWPVSVLSSIDVKRIAADRDQIWAEAFVRWEAGDVWHVNTPELLAMCEAEQEERLEIDGWEEAIQRWFNDPAKFSRDTVTVEPGSVFKGVSPFDGSRGVTTTDVLEHAIGKLKGQWTSGDTQRVGKILQKRLGMKRSRVQIEKSREWRYLFPST